MEINERVKFNNSKEELKIEILKELKKRSIPCRKETEINNLLKAAQIIKLL